MKPCLVCGEPTSQTRCEEHQLVRPPQRPGGVRGTSRWQRLSRRLRRMQDWCSACGSRDNLTVDHVVPISRGGDPFDVANLDVLCQPCNSVKGTRPGEEPRPGLSPMARVAAKSVTHPPGVSYEGR